MKEDQVSTVETQQAVKDDTDVLAALETLLREQLSLAREGKADQVWKLTDGAAELLSLALTCQATPADGGQVRRIQRMYNEICLTLAAEKQSLADRLAQARTGLKTLHAYQTSATLH